MIGTIGIKDLEILCIIGIYPAEREHEQPLLLSLEAEYPFKAAAQTEDIQQTIDYAVIAQQLTDLAIEGKFQLIETLAERSAQYLLKTYPQIQRIILEIKKPKAIPSAAYPYVRIERFHHSY
ncbi:dihydroneopterin aldolase [Beggiatoa alba B18LD]|uniref:7,8-dihydroneopterin aldolase n=1 Tax=Beggiatoa alba B18LD TaxID=395493 RepID=I3CD44_9GAMM|nr:dihydroneopterin aldolase [Beggiatoa alba]EIJ41537.1 dihydroneopterin aldolase [Beggiatoa alba B18LD]